MNSGLQNYSLDDGAEEISSFVYQFPRRKGGHWHAMIQSCRRGSASCMLMHPLSLQCQQKEAFIHGMRIVLASLNIDEFLRV